MQYLKVTFNVNDALMACRDNLRKALIHIGKQNPLQVKQFSLKFNKKLTESHKTLNEKHYLSCGILNIRKKINTNLGKCGKFSNRMIRFMLLKQYESGANLDFDAKEVIKIHQKMFVKIAKAIAEILHDIDSDFANELFNYTVNENRISLNKFKKGCSVKIATPMQAHMVLTSTKPELELNKEIMEELKNA